MKTASITEAKNGLSALIDRVRAGETILITDRGIPVARIEPVERSDQPVGRLERLVRAGIARPPSTRMPSRLLDTPPPRPLVDVDVVGIVLEERRSGW
jgi:prevent-host-death family protein